MKEERERRMMHSNHQDGGTEVEIQVKLQSWIGKDRLGNAVRAEQRKKSNKHVNLAEVKQDNSGCSEGEREGRGRREASGHRKQTGMKGTRRLQGVTGVKTSS